MYKLEIVPLENVRLILRHSEIFVPAFDILHSVGELPWSLLVKDEEGEKEKGST